MFRMTLHNISGSDGVQLYRVMLLMKLYEIFIMRVNNAIFALTVEHKWDMS